MHEPATQSVQIAARGTPADPYQRLNAALSLAAATPCDAALLDSIVTGFLDLGLVTAAGEIAQRGASPDTAPPSAVNPTPERSDGVRPDRIDWRAQQPTFEANLAVALDRFEDVRRNEALIRRSTNGLDLFRSRDGNLHLSRKIGSGPRRWLPALCDGNALAARLNVSPPPGTLLCDPIVLENLFFGQVLERAWRDTRKMFLTFTPRIHIIEPNYAQFAVWLHLRDWREILADPRVLFWLGPEAETRFSAGLLAESHVRLPQSVGFLPGWGRAKSSGGAAQALLRAHQEMAARCAALRASIHTRLAPAADLRRWSDRFAQRAREPLRVLGLTSRYTTFLQYSMRDLGEAVRSLGHEFRLVIEGDDHSPSVSLFQTLHEVESFRPDLIVIIDHNRHEYAERFDFPIPYCNWIQDELPNLFSPGSGKNLHSHDIVVGHLDRHTAHAADYPWPQCRYLPVPVNPQLFTDTPISAEAKARLACDVSLVTHLSQPPADLLRERLDLADAPMRRLMSALYETWGPRVAAGDLPATPLQSVGLIQQQAAELGLQISHGQADDLRRQFFDRLISTFFRHQVLHWAAELGVNLRIYGRGWEKHPTLGRFAAGVAENGQALRGIYQSAAINLQLVPQSAYHQRLFEGLCSGGFFLIRRTPADANGPLIERVARRCIELNIETEQQLLETRDSGLAADMRILFDRLYAPLGLPIGFVSDLRGAIDPGPFGNAGARLPRYQDVQFGTRAEFEALVKKFLADPGARAEIAGEQRRHVVNTMSYEAIAELIFSFVESSFRRRA